MSTIKQGAIQLLQSQMMTIFLYLVVCLTWGTTWIGIKVAVETVPPLMASGLRFMIAFPFLAIICFFLKAPILFQKNQTIFFIILTLFYFTIPYYLISYGEQYVSSGLTSLLFSTMPIFSIIFSVLLLREKASIAQYLGIIIGFFCLVKILQSEGIALNYNSLLGVIAILLAAMFHGFLYVFSKKKASDINIFTFNTLPIGCAGLILCLASLFVENPNFSTFSSNSLIALVYLAIFASVFGFLIYFYLLRRMSPIILSFIFIIFPVFAVAIDMIYQSKQISATFIFYSTIMLIGFSMTKIPFNVLIKKLINYFKAEK